MSEEQEIVLPSGQIVTLLEVLSGAAGDEGTWFFRFLAPDLARDGVDYERLAPDLEALCRTVALPRTAAADTPAPDRVVIALAARKTRFGEAAPDVAQVFEAYSISDNNCQWEPF
jgi:hypothetical protein